MYLLSLRARLVAGFLAGFLVAFSAACSSAPGDHGTGSSSTSTSASSTTSGAGGAMGTGGMPSDTGTGGMASSTSTGGMPSGSGGSGGAGGEVGVGMPCSVDGNPGTCELVSTCEAMTDHTSTPGYCPGPADVECCTKTPNVADNPPVPTGWVPMMQSEVTPDMTTWAVMILNDPKDYPMFATTMMTFGTLLVMARVEWHPPDFQNMAVHRGVTLYKQG